MILKFTVESRHNKQELFVYYDGIARMEEVSVHISDGPNDPLDVDDFHSDKFETVLTHSYDVSGEKLPTHKVYFCGATMKDGSHKEFYFTEGYLMNDAGETLSVYR